MQPLFVTERSKWLAKIRILLYANSEGGEGRQDNDLTPFLQLLLNDATTLHLPVFVEIYERGICIPSQN